MKNRKNIIPLFLTLPLLLTISLFNRETSTEVKAASTSPSSLPTVINLNSVSESDVRAYYENLNTLSDEELRGTNLLKNLKPILRQNFEYYTYDNVWKAYEITDRDWKLSPKEEVSSYSSSTNTISEYKYGKTNNNPYVHCYYRDHKSSDSAIIEDSKITAYGDHNATGINREHIWPQSHGFKDDSGGATGPAGTDLHHLVAADGYVNQSVHNNDPYGYVKDVDKVGNRVSTSNNKVGTPKTTSSNDLATRVFEPQDQDKGDLARACFYMVAMYNNFANETGAISKFDPNLNLVSYVTKGEGSEWSSDTEVIVYGNLKDLLEWNKLDPVDEYEIYRNDLIFRNFEHNRNPFIDFPEWADIVWGELATSKSANPKSDELYKGGEYTPQPPEPENKDNKIFGLNPVVFYVIVGVAVVAVTVIGILVITKGNKKQKKTMKKVVKKSVKNYNKNHK